MNRNHFSRFRQTGGARGTRALRGMGVEAKPGGGCLACCFGGGSGREEVPSADDGEASVSSRRETATASAIAAREKDEASLASRRALANAEPVADEDAFLREPWWDDTKDDVLVRVAAPRDANAFAANPDTGGGRSPSEAFEEAFDREMDALERRHVAAVLVEQRERMGSHRRA